MIFKVFISGNQTELNEERMAVKEVIMNTPIIKKKFEPFLFEDLPSSGSNPVSTYLDEVKNSDIYLGILGMDYGNKNKDGISATEEEYDTFVENVSDGEILIFVKGDRTTTRDPQIDDFIDKTRDMSIYSRFNSIADLKEEVIKSLESFLENEGVINSEAFDKRICVEADYSAIDENEVTDFLQKRATNMDVDIPDDPIQDILSNVLKVLKTFKGHIRPTNTGILFFSENASDYIPQNVIKIARFNGVTRTDINDSKEIKGPIYKIIDEVESFFNRNTRTANKIVDYKRINIS
ncbi:MAG: DUF4062 domain-containing protein [Methanobacteriaceae archaeon]|nr:DUF4062 domain-containing protein [Methanobacteriaceae archaeon]MDP3624840.1 DUF4062 domain-containing protein [Methanobacteriaceae archaeon]